MTDTVRAYWDGQAAAFDDEPDHGLRDADTREAWRALLADHLPTAPADVLDLGCGTGSLSVLLAEEGHRVRGVDLSDEMVAAARRKAEAVGVDAVFEQGDAARPPFPAGACDVVLSRHVLWAMPDPAVALGRWVSLLRPGGVLVLVEGSWSTGAGLEAAETERLVLGHREHVEVRALPESVYWGRPVEDERYLVVSLR